MCQPIRGKVEADQIGADLAPEAGAEVDLASSTSGGGGIDESQMAEAAEASSPKHRFNHIMENITAYTMLTAFEYDVNSV